MSVRDYTIIIQGEMRRREKSPKPNGFNTEFYKTFKVESTPRSFRLFQNSEQDGILSTSFYKARITLTPKPKIQKENRLLTYP